MDQYFQDMKNVIKEFEKIPKKFRDLEKENEKLKEDLIIRKMAYEELEKNIKYPQNLFEKGIMMYSIFALLRNDTTNWFNLSSEQKMLFNSFYVNLKKGLNIPLEEIEEEALLNVYRKHCEIKIMDSEGLGLYLDNIAKSFIKVEK